MFRPDRAIYRGAHMRRLVDFVLVLAALLYLASLLIS
jgi:hypothetical protein